MKLKGHNRDWYRPVGNDTPELNSEVTIEYKNFRQFRNECPSHRIVRYIDKYGESKPRRMCTKYECDETRCKEWRNLND